MDPDGSALVAAGTATEPEADNARETALSRPQPECWHTCATAVKEFIATYLDAQSLACLGLVSREGLKLSLHQPTWKRLFVTSKFPLAFGDTNYDPETEAIILNNGASTWKQAYGRWTLKKLLDTRRLRAQVAAKRVREQQKLLAATRSSRCYWVLSAVAVIGAVGASLWRFQVV